MGLIDNIRGLFSGSKDNQPMKPQINEESEKARLADKIVNLVQRINRINSFDSSIWNLSRATTYELRRKSLDELTRLNSRLENRLAELDKQSQRRNPNGQELEASIWTGQRPGEMSEHDFDRLQTK